RTEDGVLVSGPLLPGEFTVRGDVSSQFITGLLFALPKLRGKSRLRILPPLVSRPYLDVTLAVLEAFGVRIGREDETTFRIEGNQAFRPADLTVEGDFSNAAYLDAFRLFGWKMTVGNLPTLSAQGDRVYREYFEAIEKGCPTLDVTDTPDLAPVLMALGAAIHGVRLTGTSRLKLKESDRGTAMAAELAKFGAAVEAEEDRIFVPPAPLHAPHATLSSHNDHRIVMALSLLSAEYGGEIEGAEAVNKSYPDYFDALRSLGVGVEMRET
ncbi:MAG: 3-phosphoshikimate 1-carboxyvinyltransferase, partial [Clostridia bacterium]|nr:3-phosphoshikimate 1-carboxyvinyltransferase [Clostridia bacterium]